MFFQPRGPNDNWWPYESELDTDDRGNWQVRDVELGGPPGTSHMILVGVVDEATHQQLLRRGAGGGEKPFKGLSPGGRGAARLIVHKGGWPWSPRGNRKANTFIPIT